MKTGSIFEEIPDKLDAEQFIDLVRTGVVRITRIVSTGQTTRWLEPADEEWVIVLRGAAVLRFEEGDDRLSMRSGDWCYIPKGCRHRVEETSDKEPTVWIAVHFQPSV